tara:strand:+ start:227 stop:472 length:246 start_codon:yes stop_codon:yes gene_type:complete
MTQKTQITTAYQAIRLPSSRNGNPRYQLETLDGNFIGKTGVDSGIAYGEVPNNSQRGECRITLHTTKRGNVYVVGVEPLTA